ncbi:MAG: arsenosugar biosynthesis radical SAM protein ArsS [Candidatus Cyclonatronum sp.]|uniref:arsenosugar biosynthesis radical SAM (seleno)protein ArsS n=1 Tax=Cyclonatronum sp. TaxID=3024185 RepID=UPI0025C2C4A0|nr:arsenosugar biosynthesis radical SAM (seleno)protein ArsS [Cyclonatronum sp.]MCH8487203.1 arsenosugar biosynthesis radical SAM protein ArsS [Cyclonatronum sp.]
MKVASLVSRGHALKDPKEQLRVINSETPVLCTLPRFHQLLEQSGLYPLRPTGIEIFQMNLGYMCNMTCKHCHVDAGPDRKEMMSRENLEHCIRAIEQLDAQTVDLTGGAPEMHPDFEWFTERISKPGRKIIVRSNLTILVTNPKYRAFPEFFKKHRMEVTCSLPFYNKFTTDKQRGEGTYDRSVEALLHLNSIGYGMPETGLELNLVYNPAGAFLPADQAALEADFRTNLRRRHGIEFSKLFTITNLPISRYLEFLVQSGNLDAYMQKLVEAYNPSAAAGVMCRNTISVAWNGILYDCDFNQMLEIPVETESSRHIRDFDPEALNARNIIVDQHCFGCTAGAGSSCGGATAKA